MRRIKTTATSPSPTSGPGPLDDVDDSKQLRECFEGNEGDWGRCKDPARDAQRGFWTHGKSDVHGARTGALGKDIEPIRSDP